MYNIYIYIGGISVLPSKCHPSFTGKFGRRISSHHQLNGATGVVGFVVFVRLVGVDLGVGGLLVSEDMSWVVTLPSNSHHQDYYIFSRGSL